MKILVARKAISAWFPPICFVTCATLLFFDLNGVCRRVLASFQHCTVFFRWRHIALVYYMLIEG